MSTMIHMGNRRTRRIVRVGLQGLMILLGALTLAYALGQLRGNLLATPSPPTETSVASAQRGQGFVPMVDSAPGRSRAIPSSATAGSAAQQQAKLERLVGPAALVQPGSVANRPVRLVIPSIQLNAPIVSAALQATEVEGERVHQWAAPDHRAAGWHYDSAAPGAHGNTVINGHHNAFGEVFRDLNMLERGDRIFLYTHENPHSFRYEITQIIFVRERHESLAVRARNANWIQPSSDGRLTLITCWPYESNTHRLILVAKPLDGSVSGGDLELN